MQPPELEDSIEIAASPAAVWDLVGDPLRMPDWSPQVQSTRLRKGYDRVEVGAQFTNLNTLDEFSWPTHGEVVRLEPRRELAFRIAENWVIWSFTLEPTATGTRLTERRDAPEGISDQAAQWTDEYVGGQENFTTIMRAGVRQTLEAIKTAAEGHPYTVDDQ